MLVVRQPFFRGCDRAGGAGQQPGAKLVLELLDLLAGSGLVQGQLQGGLGTPLSTTCTKVRIASNRSTA